MGHSLPSRGVRYATLQRMLTIVRVTYIKFVSLTGRDRLHSHFIVYLRHPPPLKEMPEFL